MNINLKSALPFIKEQEFADWQHKALQALSELEGRGGKGNEFLGWLNLPSSITADEINALKITAQNLSKGIEIVVVIGIGGSYLGAKAVIDALSHSFNALLPARKSPLVVFAGQNISEDYHAELLEILREKSAACIVISKSGTTTEPAIAFRLIKQHFEEKYGKAETKHRIVAITDAAKGALRTLAVQEGYQTFVIPDDVGGRFSVLTPVGLLPIAVAGFDIAALIKGAVEMEECTAKSEASNPAVQYAAMRSALYHGNKKIEVLVNYNPKLHFITEWWKQLYGESEGKEHKGIFPAGVDFTSDLHSMGQYLQEGERVLFETVLSVKQEQHTLTIPKDEQDLDQLNFLSGRRLSECNKMAELGTLLAHVDGGVPNIHIEIPTINEHSLGALLYFFEKACGISGYMLGVNPFDQPGVEAYKKNMFALLNKPGFEQEGAELRKRL
ncbi:MAG: glucose-6-phosphate isomerase [Bacteroidales bacterium]|nr:glucose-6-phosphate isomerase [Bacteroidales bacterium]MCL2132854.1 glucose-6-phosphate isomerase [Bacteroidales bacterium]